MMETLRRVQREIEASKLIVAMNPADITDEVRERLEAMPHVTLWESGIIEPGRAFTFKPGVIPEFGSQRVDDLSIGKDENGRQG